MAKLKTPSQLYITTKQVTVDQKLGFLNAYEPGKAAFEKKKATQIQWAYFQYLLEPKLETHNNGDVYLVGLKWEWDASVGQHVKMQSRTLLEDPPAIWDNTPMEGFKVEGSVTRWSTSNKVWRIMDPRGLEFEITTTCMEQIINDATILRGGLIDAKCVWQSNKKLIVVQ